MTIIKEDYVSFKIAKLLKEKGFDGISAIMYKENGEMCINPKSVISWRLKYWYPCLTLQMAMKWLREVHNIDIFPWKIGKGTYSCAIFNSNTGQDLSSNKDFPSEKYEETVESAIKYCLENLI
jgi:hypothetical protein